MQVARTDKDPFVDAPLGRHDYTVTMDAQCALQVIACAKFPALVVNRSIWGVYHRLRHHQLALLLGSPSPDGLHPTSLLAFATQLDGTGRYSDPPGDRAELQHADTDRDLRRRREPSRGIAGARLLLQSLRCEHALRCQEHL